MHNKRVQSGLCLNTHILQQSVRLAPLTEGQLTTTKHGECQNVRGDKATLVLIKQGVCLFKRLLHPREKKEIPVYNK